MVLSTPCGEHRELARVRVRRNLQRFRAFKGSKTVQKKRENEAQEGTNCPGLLGETVGCLDYHGLREGAQVRCVRAEKPGGEGDQWWQPLGPLDVFTWHLSPPQLRTASQCFALLRPAPSAGAEGLVLATLVAHFST